MRYFTERIGILAVVLVLVLAIGACQSGPAQQYKAAKATRMTNPLAVRLSNYGQFQEAT